MEKDRINDTEKSFLSGKKRMDKLKVLMKYAGISVFEYFPDSDRMVLYNEQLEEEKGIMPFLGQLGQICTIHPEDVQKMREFLLGQTLGTVELKLLKKGHYKRVLLDALQKEEGDQSVIGCIRDITEIRKREELLEDQARRDSMTGLYNHDTGKLLVNEYLREKRMDASSGLLMLDVDHFKNVNDVYGHLFGDEVLIGFSGFLQSFFRKEDILIRTGGDEFVVFLKEISREALEKKVSELVKRVGKLTFSKRDFVMSCSVGVCFLPGGLGDYSYEQLLEHADLALYRAKIAGRNQYAVGEKLIPLDTGNKGETAVKLLMDETMEKREFEIYFQPKISLHNYKIVGAEALVRWRRPDGIVVRPEHFLPFYEKNGKIVELDFYVFEQVAAFLEKTKRSGITPVPVSVNVSALHAEDPQTTRRYLEILEKYKVDPGMLEMELKETDTIRYENIKDLLRSLQEAGFHTALDNFGVGSSFINLIADVPLNDVKLGRGFMEKCEKDYRGIDFLRQMIGMLKSLGFQVLCEGVESARQVEVLKTSGCDHVQGNWFSMPLSAKEFEKMLFLPGEIFYRCRKNEEHSTGGEA